MPVAVTEPDANVAALRPLAGNHIAAWRSSHSVSAVSGNNCSASQSI